MEDVYQRLVERVRQLRRRNPQHPRRLLIAFVGPPGSGKSTVASKVVERINAQAGDLIRKAIVLPMDGFHLTREALKSMHNSEEAIARRGAQWTFDATGVVGFIGRLDETREDPTLVQYAPAFDHAIKDPAVNAIEIAADVDLVLIEGNWLLLDEMPWCQIAAKVDDTWFIDVDRDLALRRVAQRHIESGIERDWEQALYRAEHNDMVNGDLVRGKSLTPNVLVKSVQTTM